MDLITAGLSGLASFVGLTEDEEATAKAARTAQSAADLAESGSHGIEMTHTSPSYKPQSGSFQKVGQSSGSYDISRDLSKETAEAAVKKLADLRGESQKLRSHDQDVRLEF